MTILDSINWSAVSAIATILTGVIVWWYTLETKKLRIIAQEQAEATDRQLGLAEKQFELTKKEADQRMKDSETLWSLNRRAADPIFHLGKWAGNRVDCSISNDGGRVFDLVVDASSVHSSATVTPSAVLEQRGTLRIVFGDPALLKLQSFGFYLCFTNTYGERKRVRLEVNVQSITGPVQRGPIEPSNDWPISQS